MVTHSKYRWIFNTQKVDRDLPREEYEERTLAEKVAYDIKYPENYDKRVYDFFSWRFHHKQKTKSNVVQPKDAKYGEYVIRDNSETISSVDSDMVIDEFYKIDAGNHDLYVIDEKAFSE